MEKDSQELNINQDDIITITDEDGNEHNCVILDIIEYKNKNYAALIPENSVEDEDIKDSDSATDLFIMEIESTDNEDFLKSIEENEEYEEICQLMIERLSENFDIEE